MIKSRLLSHNYLGNLIKSWKNEITINSLDHLETGFENCERRAKFYMQIQVEQLRHLTLVNKGPVLALNAINANVLTC